MFYDFRRNSPLVLIDITADGWNAATHQTLWLTAFLVMLLQTWPAVQGRRPAHLRYDS
jgi:hypothetical protein